MLTQEIIDGAMQGDEKSLSMVYLHYKGYIRMICTEYMVLSSGEKEKTINTEMEGEIITHLLMQIAGMGNEQWKKYF